jgi:hypothetical protein
MSRRPHCAIMSHHPLRWLAVLTTVLIGVTSARSAWALVPGVCDPDNNVKNGACYGLEPTFTNDDVKGQEKGGTAAQLATKKWLTSVPDACKAFEVHCRIEKFQSDLQPLEKRCSLENKDQPNDPINIDTGEMFRVCIFPDGQKLAAAKAWYYEVTYDNRCIELKTRPSNLPWLERLATSGTLKALMFDIATSAGLAPRLSVGGGHVHIDVESGFASATHVLNFMTAIHNLRMLPLAPDMKIMALNAPPLSALGADARARYAKFVPAHRGDVALTKDTVKVLLDALAEDVYQATYVERVLGDNKADRELLESRFQTYYQITYEKRWPIPLTLDAISNIEHRKQVEGLDAHVTRLRNKDDDLGSGWAHKAQHIRMAPQYGTIELRNIGGLQDAGQIIDIVTMIRTGIAAAPSSGEPIVLGNGLALDDTDGDTVKSWRDDETGPTKRFKTRLLTSAEANDIADRFAAFVNNPERLCRLRPLMPELVKQRISATCQVDNSQN